MQRLSLQSNQRKSNQRTLHEICLARGLDGFGFTIAGGANTAHSKIYISRIFPGSAAYVDGRLEADDVLLSVNNKWFVNIAHDVAVQTIINSGESIRMLVLKKCPCTSKVSEIKLFKGDNGLGFSIIGGTDGYNFINDNDFYVSKILDNGAAFADSRLSVGDKIISIKTKKFDKRLENLSHAEAVALMSEIDGQVVLKVEKFFVNFSNENQIPLFKTATKQRSRSREDTLVSRKKIPQKPIPAPRRKTIECAPTAPVETMPHEREADLSKYSSELVKNESNFKKFYSLRLLPRAVVIPKCNTNMGFDIECGENGKGIYISSVPTLSKNLKCGDQLLSVNGISLMNATFAEAVHALRCGGEAAFMVVQQRPERVKSIGMF